MFVLAHQAQLIETRRMAPAQKKAALGRLIRSWLQNINHQTVNAPATSSVLVKQTSHCSCRYAWGLCVALLGRSTFRERHPWQCLGQVHEGDVHICLAQYKTAIDYCTASGFPQ
ncbi:hypothetical protein [Hydrogenophaga atypica]|uniref:Uncharacterized protein n=1 Tax=Hydrogenophaga atypica TaxID=249409 RepID=A0ABW2QGK1_9BURK